MVSGGCALTTHQFWPTQLEERDMMPILVRKRDQLSLRINLLWNERPDLGLTQCPEANEIGRVASPDYLGQN